MRASIFSFYLGVLFLPLGVAAQLRLPQPSPAAIITQTIGLTQVTLKYHTPGVKNRAVWGELVPFNQVWRTGANEATLITFSDPVTINGEALAAGTYSLFSLPERLDSWLVIFNTDATLWGTEGYSAAADALRVKAQASADSFHETFQFAFSDLSPEAGTLSFCWEKQRVGLKVAVNTNKKALLLLQEDLKKAKADDWQMYAQAANYLIQEDTEHELALAWLNKSIGIQDNFYNNWLKAQLLALKAEFDGAIALGKKAAKLGKKAPAEYQKYESDIERYLNIWKVKRHGGEGN